MTVPLYAARVSDLIAGKTVTATCICGHVGLIPVSLLKNTRSPDEHLNHLADNMRCVECGVRGKVDLYFGRALWRPDARPAPR